MRLILLIFLSLLLLPGDGIKKQVTLGESIVRSDITASGSISNHTNHSYSDGENVHGQVFTRIITNQAGHGKPLLSWLIVLLVAPCLFHFLLSRRWINYCTQISLLHLFPSHYFW